MPMKKLTILLTVFILSLAPTAFGAIYTYNETEDIMNGVQLRHIRRYDAYGWLNINAVSADLKAPNIKLELLKGVNTDSLTSMAGLVSGSENRVLAAANGDFFDNTRPAYSQGFSIGLEVKGGELLQSQVDESMAAAFYSGGRLTFSYMSMSITLTAPNGNTEIVRHLNKHTDYYGDILMYTSDWNNGFSPAPGGDVVEVVVRDDTVMEFRRNMPPVEIPADGYVLVVSEGVNMFLANNLNVGDHLELTITATPSLEDVDTAFGGGTLLLSGGVRTEFTHVAYGNQPRTCVGTNADGTVVYIITVDGRQYQSRGVTQEELADIALELGCVNALNLDGGGSTRMMVQTVWDNEPQVVNLPTENRKVINAVSITTTAEPGPATNVKLRAADDAVLVGDIFPIEVRYTDENGLGAAIQDGEVSFSAEGVEAQFSGTDFYPLTAGEASLTAALDPEGAVSAPLSVHVIGQVSTIGLPQEIDLAVGENLWLTPDVSDGNYTAVVRNPNLLSPTTDDPTVATYFGGLLTGVSPGYTVLTLSYEGVTVHSLVKVGEPTASAPDLPDAVTADSAQGILAGQSFGVFAASRDRNTLLDNLVYGAGLRKLALSDSYGLLGLYRADALPAGLRVPIQANKFSAIDKGFALIISLPANGSLSSDEWWEIDEAVKATSAGTVIVLTNTAPSGKEAYDTELFYDYFDGVSQGKNVFVVQAGRANGCTLRNRVRLLTLADASLYTSPQQAVNDTWTLRFTVADGECRYSFEKLYN